jgi:prepilin-type N-terminal cleavage/methylation domain-containing protein
MSELVRFDHDHVRFQFSYPIANKHLQILAFTLVEMLVAIAIIGILIAMLLPAVQMVREAGRRTVCSNNVRQLALGLMNFESGHGQLPIGLRSFEPSSGSGSGSAATQYYGMSWITRILPFIEQNAMWDNAIEDYRHSPIPFRSHRGMQTVLNSVTCPSDPVAGELQWTHEGRLVVCTNYLGVNGTNYRTRDGVFTYDEPIRLAEIGDGQSNRLLIGERPPSPDFWYGWWYATGQGSISTGDVTLGVAEVRIDLANENSMHDSTRKSHLIRAIVAEGREPSVPTTIGLRGGGRKSFLGT